MPETTKPGPCPFCGSTDTYIRAKIRNTSLDYSFRAACAGCSAEGPSDSRLGAIARWNACNKAQLLAACKAMVTCCLNSSSFDEALSLANAAITAAEPCRRSQ